MSETTDILYPSQKVFALKAMTHSEYHEDKWKDECGCFAPPPPKKKKKAKGTRAARKPKGR